MSIARFVRPDRDGTSRNLTRRFHGTSSSSKFTSVTMPQSSASSSDTIAEYRPSSSASLLRRLQHMDDFFDDDDSLPAASVCPFMDDSCSLEKYNTDSSTAAELRQLYFLEVIKPEYPHATFDEKTGEINERSADKIKVKLGQTGQAADMVPDWQTDVVQQARKSVGAFGALLNKCSVVPTRRNPTNPTSNTKIKPK
jgi:hypothetical protein